jgi:hypothetical protein
MNVLEMVAQTFAKQMAEQGPEMVAKMLASLPPDIVATIGQIRDVALSYKAQLNRIENQQRLILTHLNIPLDVETTEDGENARQRELPAN